MKRLVVLLFLLIVASSVYYFIESQEDSKMTKLISERAFNIKDLDDLNRMVITEKNKKSIILQKNSDLAWEVNSKYLARKNAVDNLLEVIKEVEIKYIPEKTATKNIINEMRAIGVRVDLYNDRNSLIKSYQVGGSTQDERGTYMMMNTDNQKRAQPFVVQIPSIEGSVRGRFILSETDWRDRSILKEDVSKLSFVKVEYPDNPNESFTIKFINKKPAIYSGNGQQESTIDKSKVNAYLQGFDEVYAEYIDNLNPLRDSISRLVPFSIINFGNSISDYKTIKLFPLSDLIYEKGDQLSNTSLETGGRYFVDCSWGDFMLAQHRLIGKLLRGKSFFELK